MALDGRVLDVGLAAALAEAALVEGQHAVPGVEEGRNAVGSVVREPPQPWLCMSIGTRWSLVAPAGLKSV